MLGNVLDAYLDRVRERQFDAPFLLLLPRLGFFDIHYTHGPVEFGRDVIAKKVTNSEIVQYSFQLKSGNISQHAWENVVRRQLETALRSKLSHPNFAKELQHRVVLVTTGDLRNNAALGFQEFNENLKDSGEFLPVDVWSKHTLLRKLLEYGLGGIHMATAAGYGEYGEFFRIYSRTLQGLITTKEIEQYSRSWSKSDIDRERRVLLAAIESEVLAQQCLEQDLTYEAIQIYLARLRMLCEAVYDKPSRVHADLWTQALLQLQETCSAYISRFRTFWKGDRDLVKQWLGDVSIVTYPVQCARTLEIGSLAYFTAATTQTRRGVAAFLREFVSAEPGCARPLSDRYAVSIALPALVLMDSGNTTAAADLLRSSTIWVADKHEDGPGLPSIEATEGDETNALLGSALEFFHIAKHDQSLLATAITDLAAFLGDAQLYADIVNDLKAVQIHPEYWQAIDSVGAVRFEGDDVLHYPSIEFSDTLPDSNEPYAPHIGNELSTFKFVEFYGPVAAVVVMSLLRDRYFPGLFARIAPDYDGPHTAHNAQVD